MQLEELKKVYHDELNRLEDLLHNDEEVDNDLLNDIGIESFCMYREYFNNTDYAIGNVRGMKLMLDLMEGIL